MGCKKRSLPFAGRNSWGPVAGRCLFRAGSVLWTFLVFGVSIRGRCDFPPNASGLGDLQVSRLDFTA